MPQNLGSQDDPAVTDSTAQASITAILKGLLSLLSGGGSSGMEVIQDTAADLNATVTIATGTKTIGDLNDIVGNLPTSIQGPENPTFQAGTAITSTVVDLAASTADQALVATQGAGRQIWVLALFLMADTAAGTIVFQDEDDTALSGTIALSDEGGFVLPFSGNFNVPWMKVATNKALEADTGACTVDGIILWASIEV